MREIKQLQQLLLLLFWKWLKVKVYWKEVTIEIKKIWNVTFLFTIYQVILGEISYFVEKDQICMLKVLAHCCSCRDSCRFKTLSGHLLYFLDATINKFPIEFMAENSIMLKLHIFPVACMWKDFCLEIDNYMI